jgi:hypothetical protein
MPQDVDAVRGPRWLLLIGLGVGLSDVMLQLTVPQMQRGPAALASMAAAVCCLVFVIMDAGRTPGRRRSRPSPALRLAAKAARAGGSPRWIARVFRLPVAFAELLAAEARHDPQR